MPEIVNLNHVSIQCINVARQTVAGATTLIQAVTLDRAGRFLGASVSMDCDLANNLTSINIRNTNDSELTYGQALTSFEVSIRNANAGDAQIGFHIVMYIGV